LDKAAISKSFQKQASTVKQGIGGSILKRSMTTKGALAKPIQKEIFIDEVVNEKPKESDGKSTSLA
jgi:hypothetical protein